MEEIYLDNSATTKPFASVCQIMMETMETAYGNPSSMHKKGIKAEHYIHHASDQIAKTLKVSPKEIFYTSGGTESNNMALIGTALANKRIGSHIITTQIEHPSVHNPLLFLKEQGFELTFLPVDSFGHIKKEDLLNAIREDTILISIMYVNNEIGTLEPVAELAKAAKEKKTDILVHSDAVQAYGKYQIYPKKEGIDLLSISGHKIHGPKGIGALYISDKVKIKPILYGGGQQKGMRSGTENVSGIAGLGMAAEEMYQNYKEKIQELYQKKSYFIEQIVKIEGTTVNGVKLEKGIQKVEETATHIISVSFAGIKSEVLLHALEEKGIYVSSGSACASNHPKLSNTLKAIGVKRELMDATLRFSMSGDTTKQELDIVLETLKNLLPQLRRFIRN